VRAASIVMLFFVASRILGLVRDIVISHQFGTSRELDAYFAAFNIPDFIFNVVAGGALGSAFIPTFSAALAQNDLPRAWRLAGAIIVWTFGIVAAICAVLAIFAPQVVALTVGRGFASNEQQLTADLMRWMLITPIVFSVSGIVMGILNSHQHFVLPALAPVMYNAAIIAGALWLAPVLGVYGLVVGVVAGAVLHLAVQLPWLGKQRGEIRDWGLPSFNLQALISSLQSPDVRHVVRLMLPRTFGIAAVQINFLINTILASTLPAGRIAALAYAWRVMLLPVGVVGQSLATAVFPTFSAQTARHELDDFRRTFSVTFRTTLYLTIPATVGLFLLGAPLIALLFQRGEFDAQSTSETAFALQFYALALFAHSSLEIVARAFYALHDTLTPVAVGIGAMVVNIGLSIALLAPLAHGGLALANSIATILELLMLLFILRHRLGDIDLQTIAASLARVVIASLLMGAAIAWLANALAVFGSIIVAGICIIVGAAIYLGLTLMMRSNEIEFVLRRIKRKT
jgi:putative peptidoglycan lipid II flippase